MLWLHPDIRGGRAQGGQEPAVFDRILPLIVVTVAVLSIARAVPAGEPAKKPTSILAFSVQDIDGKPVGLSKYKGDVLLIVNTASQCGSTPQYERLESICETYKPQGFDSNSRTAISQGKTRGSRRRSSQTLVQYYLLPDWSPTREITGDFEYATLLTLLNTSGNCWGFEVLAFPANEFGHQRTMPSRRAGASR